MEPTDLQQLLASPESSSLDWKAAFPKGLAGGSTDDGWDKGRAELIRDTAALANTVDSRAGRIVYGVKDLGASRKVLGTSLQLDDADVQQWLENHLDPARKVEFGSATLNEVRVVILEVYAHPLRPHVVARSLGGLIHEGQVWFRRGTKNTIALRQELSTFFERPEPLRARLDSSLVKSVGAYYTRAGFRTRFMRYLEKDSHRPEGWELALDPDSGKEIWVGGTGSTPELILMKREGPDLNQAAETAPNNGFTLRAFGACPPLRSGTCSVPLRCTAHVVNPRTLCAIRIPDFTFLFEKAHGRPPSGLVGASLTPSSRQG